MAQVSICKAIVMFFVITILCIVNVSAQFQFDDEMLMAPEMAPAIPPSMQSGSMISAQISGFALFSSMMVLSLVSLLMH
ncbi:hypothetical protein FRX31_007394 [Thalictrum thalictroides]|uniref:Transmembrane protein n=1 Tax=Thalictrum thalictroides TaxID=46969 RepID=A0A7J6X2J8_THATH|nr:hypothetical protein FRX31_007394 [Thalictrum thalictroides]